jgi:ElaB/YqjD/DUF883 family membrane-anchored ribosome-binding protein
VVTLVGSAEVGDIEHSAASELVSAVSGLGNRHLSGRGNALVRAAMMQQAQQTYGNRAVRRQLQRTVSLSAPSLGHGFARGMSPISTPSIGMQPTADVAVQRCGGEVHPGCTACGGDIQQEEMPVQTMPVQRIPSWNDIKEGASSAVSTVTSLPSGILDGIRSVYDKVMGKESETDTWAGDHEAKSNETLDKSSDEAEKQSRATGEQVKDAGTKMESESKDGEAKAGQEGKQYEQTGKKEITKVSNIGKAVGPAVSPLTPMVDPGKVQSGTSSAGSAAQAASGGTAGPAVSDIQQGAQKEVDNKSWNCDAVDVVSDITGKARSYIKKMADFVDKVTGGRAKMVAAVLDIFMGGIISKIALIIGGIQKLAPYIKKFWDDKVKPIINKVTKVIDKVKAKYNKLKEKFTKKYNEIKEAFLKKWNAAKDFIGKKIKEKIDQVKKDISNGINKVKSLISGLSSALYKLLPDWARKAVDKAGEVIDKITNKLKQKWEALKKKAAKVKDKAVEAVKKYANDKVKEFAGYWNRAKELWGKAKEKLKQAKDYVISIIPKPIKDAVQAVKDWASKWGNKAKAAAGKVMGAIGNTVCEALDEEKLKKCADKHLPQTSGGSSIKLTGAAEVVIPLEVVNIKVGSGASITVNRSEKDPNWFGVTIEGEGALFITAPMSGGGGDKKGGDDGGSASVSVDIPTGAKAEVWKALVGTAGGGGQQAGSQQAGSQNAGTGGAGGTSKPGATSGSSGTPATTPQPGTNTPAPSDKKDAGGTASYTAEAGFKGKSSITYSFHAGDKNCKGLGGLVGLLAAYGVAGSLPSPLSNLAAMGVQENYKDQMTKLSFELSREMTIGAEAAAQLAKISGKLSMSQGVTIGWEKKGSGEGEPYDPTKGPWSGIKQLSLGGSISVGGSLEVPELKQLGEFSGNVSGELKLVLSADDDFNISAISFDAGAKASLTVPAVKDFDTSKFAPFLPQGLETIRQRLLPLQQAGAKGTIEASANYKVDVYKIMQELGKYLQPSNVANVTAAGALDIAAKQLKDTKPEFGVTFTETSRLGVSGEAKDKGAGVSGSAGIGRTLVHKLYP